MLIKEIDNPVNDFRELNNDIEALNSWSKKWLITFNAEKTKYLISSRKPKKCTHSSLIPDSVSIKQVLRYKHLGLIFSDKMTWSDHIDDSCKRSNKHLDVIAKMRYILPRLCIEKLHNSFVCSMLDYSDVIYYNCSNIDSTKIENIQQWACIILMGAVRETRYKTPLKEAGVEPLKTRRKLHRLTYLFKIKKKLTPDYLVNIHVQNYDLRRPSQLIPIRDRTAIYYNSSFAATIRDWNSLPKDVLSARSV